MSDLDRLELDRTSPTFDLDPRGGFHNFLLARSPKGEGRRNRPASRAGGVGPQWPGRLLAGIVTLAAGGSFGSGLTLLYLFGWPWLGTVGIALAVGTTLVVLSALIGRRATA